MRTHLLRLLTAVVAISVLLFASVASAQDESETPMTQAECEAAGYVWTPEDWWQLDGPPGCIDLQNETIIGYGVETSPGRVEAYPETVQAPPESSAAEPAPVEQAPTSDLPATQPAQAQHGSPQYTG